jgi:peptidoglycan hydrolase-like protein with peptidoglycan-binding domain
MVTAAPTVQARRIRFRPRTLVAAVVVAALIAFAVVVATSALGGGGSSPGSADNVVATGVARIEKRSLSSQTQVSATLGYADPTTIVVPAGTAPSNLQQAQQTAATDQGMLQSAQATLASDTETLAQLRAASAAALAKEAVDCQGTNAAASPAAADAAGGGSGSTPCASDEQTVTTDEQSETQAAAKVVADQSQVSSAHRGLAAAQSALAADESSGSIYGQSSAYTALPPVGKIVKRGERLFSISGQPVVLFYGPVAAWRAFLPGMSAGRDVAELNRNLEALGYEQGPFGDSFTSGTSAAIDAFQSAHGLTQTGQLLLGSIVFEPGRVRVTAVTPTVGATVQPGPVLSVTSTRRQVTIALDAAQQSQLKVGDPVVITLPDNSTTPGRVSYVGTVATTPSSDQGGGGGGSATPTIEVDVAPSDPAATGHLDQAPVNVSITTASVRRALVVPVNALLALANGGYALEEIGSGGAHQLVAVNLGLFDDQDGLVQVTGTGLAAGQRVVVPSE